MVKKIIITGGTYSGKTTVLKLLEKRGFETIPEAAMQIIEENVTKVGQKEHQEEIRSDFKKFALLFMKRQEKLESNIKSDNIVFLERGFVDFVALCKLMKIDVPKQIQEKAKKVVYDKVFLLENLPDFDKREGTGRISDKDFAINMREELKKAYNEFGYEYVCVPLIDVEKRVDLILKELNLI